MHSCTRANIGSSGNSIVLLARTYTYVHDYTVIFVTAANHSCCDDGRRHQCKMQAGGCGNDLPKKYCMQTA